MLTKTSFLTLLVQPQREETEKKCSLLLFFWNFCHLASLQLENRKKEISVAKLTGIKEKIDGAEGKKEWTCLTGAVAQVFYSSWVH